MNEQKVEDLHRQEAEELTSDQAEEARGGISAEGYVAGKPIKIPAIADEHE